MADAPNEGSITAAVVGVWLEDQGELLRLSGDVSFHVPGTGLENTALLWLPISFTPLGSANICKQTVTRLSLCSAAQTKSHRLSPRLGIESHFTQKWGI
jgi:hypothetical protein